MISVEMARRIKRHYEGVKRVVANRIEVLVKSKKLNEFQREELKTLQYAVAPLDRLAEDINLLIAGKER